MRFSIILICLLLSFTNCSKDHLFDCVKSTGDEITEHRSVKHFTNINMKDNIDVILYSDTTDFISVYAGEHLIDGIITEVDGNTLYLRNENKCNWVRSFSNKYIVTIGMRDPEKIESYGSGNITCMDSIRTDEFFFDSWNASGSYNFIFSNPKIHLNNNIGRADFHATGKTQVAFAYINDVATLDTKELSTNLYYIRNSSTGDCSIRVNQELSSEITYTGNIYYIGNPYSVVSEVTGTGKLIHQ